MRFLALRNDNDRFSPVPGESEINNLQFQFAGSNGAFKAFEAVFPIPKSLLANGNERRRSGWDVDVKYQFTSAQTYPRF